MLRSSTLSRFALVMTCLLVPVAAATSAPAVVGNVAAVDGIATATTPGEGSRLLVCGDEIHADERLTTASGARLVVAREGRHVHVGPDSVLLFRDGAGEAGEIEMVRGHARVIDANDRPASLVATSTGGLRTDTSDFEIRRLASGDLQVCDWSKGVAAACRRIDRDGLQWQIVEEGPRLDLGIRDLCPWQGREGFAVADFTSTPPVAAAPAASFEPELDPQPPGCEGDECAVFQVDPAPAEIVYTVAPPSSFIP